MSSQVSFTIPGAPIALQRARKGKHGFYDPQRHMKNAMMIYLSHYEGPLLTGPLFLSVYFYMPIPKITSKKKIEEMKGTCHHLRPDADNMQKWIFDICQDSGNIFKDDASIAAGLFFKVWEENKQARTTFTFTPINDRKIKKEIDINFLLHWLTQE